MDLLENVGRRREAKGDVGNFVNVGGFSLNGYERNNLFHNLGGNRFEDTGYVTGADLIDDGRGVAAIDIENDGDLDLVIENYLQPARLLVNRGTPGNHWLELKLVGAGPRNGGSNRSALGARAVVWAGGNRFTREVVSSGGYLSGFSRVLHFGLGKVPAIEMVEVRWPSGQVQLLGSLAMDRKHRIEEPRGEFGSRRPSAAPGG
jgi:hypothetical protein